MVHVGPMAPSRANAGVSCGRCAVTSDAAASVPFGFPQAWMLPSLSWKLQRCTHWGIVAELSRLRVAAKMLAGNSPARSVLAEGFNLWSR
jgi:hypothetical protein